MKSYIFVLLGLSALCLGSEVSPDHHHGGGSGPCRRRSHGWSSWSDWGDCDVPCGSGEMAKTRECCGDRCKGPNSVTRYCSNGPCIPIVIDKDKAVCSGMSFQFTSDVIVDSPWWDDQYLTSQAELILWDAINSYCMHNLPECFGDGKIYWEEKRLRAYDIWTSQYDTRRFRSGFPDFKTLYNMRHTMLAGIASQPNVMSCIPFGVFEKVFNEDLAHKIYKHFLSQTEGDLRMTAWEIVPHNELGVQPEPTPTDPTTNPVNPTTPTETWIRRLRVSRLMIITLACLAIFSGLAVVFATCLICMKRSKRPEKENPKKNVKIALPVAPYLEQGVINKGFDI